MNEGELNVGWTERGVNWYGVKWMPTENLEEAYEAVLCRTLEANIDPESILFLTKAKRNFATHSDWSVEIKDPGKTFETMIGDEINTFRNPTSCEWNVCPKRLNIEWDKHLSRCLVLKHLICQSSF